jgi:F0F1-type ATP synthase epsilon subunit
MSKLLLVIVQDTEQIIFEGQSDRVTSYNEIGRFDVYPTHANFISIIKQQLDIYNNHQKVKELKIEQAIMKVKADEVRVYLGIESLNMDDIDPVNAPPPPDKK